MSKRKGNVTVQLEPDEACVVLEKKFWDHMLEIYKIYADDSADPVEQRNWISVIDAVQYWVDRTHFDPSEMLNIDDEWD